MVIQDNPEINLVKAFLHSSLKSFETDQSLKSKVRQVKFNSLESDFMQVKSQRRLVQGMSSFLSLSEHHLNNLNYSISILQVKQHKLWFKVQRGWLKSLDNNHITQTNQNVSSDSLQEPDASAQDTLL